MTAKRLDRWKYSGAVLGLAVGTLSVFVGDLETTSSNPLIELLQKAAMTLVLPGLIASMIFSNNVHAFSLVVAAISNLVIYGLLGGVLSRLVVRQIVKH